MQHYRGIVLTSEELRTATELLEKLYQEAKALTYQYRTTASLYEVINMITVAQEIVVQSLDKIKIEAAIIIKTFKLFFIQFPSHKEPREIAT